MKAQIAVGFVAVGISVAALLPVARECWPAQRVFDSEGVYSTFATVAGALLGFSIAAAAIMLQTLSGPAFKRVRVKNDYLALYRDLRHTIAAFGTTTVFSLIGVLLVESGENTRDPWIFGTVTSVSIYGAVFLAKSLNVLWLVINAHANSESDFKSSG